MPTKPIDRLLFAQGGECFFCKQVLPKSDASLEHLVAQTHGGKDNDENVVVCCKTLNALFGRMSLKEKLEVILKQRGAFGCPANARISTAAAVAATSIQGQEPLKAGSPLAVAVENLKKRGNARPTSLDKLANTIKTALEHQKLDGSLADKVLAELQSLQWVLVDGEKVSYHLPLDRVKAAS